jgi:two-component system, cell cycle response regulator DivK
LRRLERPGGNVIPENDKDEPPESAEVEGADTEPLFDALVVEDEPDTRELLRRVLSHAGIRPVVVADAMQALKQLETFTPDILIIDLALPGMNGLQLLDSARANPDSASIPAVAVTAFSVQEEYSPERAKVRGFEGYLEKPIDALTFAQRIQRYVKLDAIRSRAHPCEICSRTDDPLLDVISSGEGAALFLEDRLAHNVIYRAVYDNRIEARESGRAWLLRYIEVAAKWGDGRLPPFRYWEIPDLPCPVCNRTGDPLSQVIAVTDESLVSLGSEAVKRVRTAASQRTIPSRKSGGTWLVMKSSAQALVEDLSRPGEDAL